MTKVVVIGAGLLGSSVADELAGRGAEVTVLDAGRPGSGTSGSSFAWVNAQDKSPQPYFELNAAGVAAYPALARDLGGDWYHPGGDLAIGRGPGAARLAGRIGRHRDLGYAVDELDRTAAATLEPHLSLPDDGEVVFAHFPDEAWIDAPALIERRLARATERGASVRGDTRVTGFDADGGRLGGVLADGETVPADLVLLAAGPTSEALAGMVGVPLPMAPSPGLLVSTAQVEGGVSRVVHAGDVALRPDGGGRVLVSSREVDATLDPSTRSVGPDDEASRELVARAGRVLPSAREASVDRVRVGVRSVAADGLPVAGFTSAVPNLYLLVAHSGASLSPVLGRLVASELLERPEAQLAAYRPDRFA